MALQVPGKGKTVTFGQLPGPAKQGRVASHAPGQAQPMQSPWSISTPYGQPGGTWDSGPVPGTTMYRPPVNPTPQGPVMDRAVMPGRDYNPSTGEWLNNGQPSGQPWEAWGGQPQAGRPPAQPGQRTPVTRPAPGRPAGQYSSMPAGTPGSLLPFFEQAQQMDPRANQFQQQELAHRLRNAQHAQDRMMRQGVQDQANAAWMAQQEMLSQQQAARDQRYADANARARRR